MALQNNTSSKQDAKDTRPDAYLNIQIKDSDGKLHTIPNYSGLALRKGSRVSDALITAAEADPDKEYELVGSINVVDKDAPAPTF